VLILIELKGHTLSAIGSSFSGSWPQVFGFLRCLFLGLLLRAVVDGDHIRLVLMLTNTLAQNQRVSIVHATSLG